jgi:chromosome segregation ATPase
MSSKVRTIFQVIVGIVLVVSLCAVESSAQKKKRRTTKRARPAAPRPVITNPPIAPADGESAGDIKIISTADEGPIAEKEAETTATKPAKSGAATKPGDDVQKSITTLSNQVNKLNEKLTQIQEDERDEREVERLTRAEQRAEQLRTQLIDVQSKIADFEAKLEMIEYSIKPENIDKITQGAGTLHPEEVRETRKRQLENERGRVQAQLKLLETSKSRLELSVTSADSEVDQLRFKLNQRREQLNATPEVKPDRPDQPW